MLGEAQVSVVIPTSGERGAELARAVDSALRQTAPVHEIIVVVDAGAEVADVVARGLGDRPLQVVATGRRSGAPRARNLGVQTASGRLIGLLDDDDEWAPDKLLRQLPHLADGASGIVACRSTVMLPGAVTVVWPRRLPRSGEGMAEYLLKRDSLRPGGTVLHTSMLLTTRELLLAHPFDESLPRHQEWDWLIRTSTRQDVRVHVVDAALVVWHCEDRASRVSTVSNWAASMAWLESLDGLVSSRAKGSFMLTFVTGLARRDEHRFSVALRVLGRALRERVGLLDVLIFLVNVLSPRPGGKAHSALARLLHARS